MEPGCKSVYIGESHNNFMTRSAQHKDKFHSRSKDESFIHKHQVTKHGGHAPNATCMSVCWQGRKLKHVQNRFLISSAFEGFSTIISIKHELDFG